MLWWWRRRQHESGSDSSGKVGSGKGDVVMVAVAKVVMEVDSDMVAVEVLVMATSKMVW